jgi:site-specific DNA-methyltransferase (adenine-specific)
LERTPEEYVDNLVAVFREVRHVLRDDGTLWLNLGDSYSAKPCSDGSDFDDGRANRGKRHSGGEVAGLKPKDLVGIPWRVAFALQADGWYLRSDIIWAKPNPMPESVKDRPTKSHEHIFLLAKSATYYYDAEAIAEPACDPPREQRKTGANAFRGQAALRPRASDAGRRKANDGFRNKRDVWTVPTAQSKIAHFATFPPALILPCILAGCPPGGTVLDPFGGSGTTGEVASGNGRSAVVCELNPDYAALAQARCGLFCGA